MDKLVQIEADRFQAGFVSHSNADWLIAEVKRQRTALESAVELHPALRKCKDIDSALRARFDAALTQVGFGDN